MSRKKLVPVTKANFYEQSCQQCRNGTGHTIHRIWCAGYDNEHVTCYCEACLTGSKDDSFERYFAVMTEPR